MQAQLRQGVETHRQELLASERSFADRDAALRSELLELRQQHTRQLALSAEREIAFKHQADLVQRAHELEQHSLTFALDIAIVTDEVNRILGVAQKSLDMQKRKRSDVIRSINAKYKLIQPMTTLPLVDRVKSDVDARLYEYYLLEDEIERIQRILNEQKQ